MLMGFAPEQLRTKGDVVLSPGAVGTSSLLPPACACWAGGFVPLPALLACKRAGRGDPSWLHIRTPRCCF